MPIITSLLDTDLYKYTMMQVVFEEYVNTNVRYEYKCRNAHVLGSVSDKRAFLLQLSNELDALCDLMLLPGEIEYLSSIRFFKPGFIEFLRMFKLNRRYIRVYLDKNEDVGVVVEGPWLSTILFEVPVLAIISELYSEFRLDPVHVGTYACGRILHNKIAFLKDTLTEDKLQSLYITDLGTRRRYSFRHHKNVLQTMLDAGLLSGTSNVYFAYHLGIKAVGTMAHEYVCAHQQLGRVEDSQRAAFQTWANVYRGDLGIALSDTVGFDAFLRDFDLYFSKLFDGARHDSGDPYEWCHRLIEHYEKMKIDPKTKIAVFSDGLTFEVIVNLFNTFNSKINTSFGIGTNLTNDVGVTPLQIVMKMVECNGRPVAKVSDSAGKGMCLDAEFEKYVRSIFIK